MQPPGTASKSSFRPILSSDVQCSSFQTFTVPSSRAAKPSVPFGGWYRGQEASM